MKKTMSESRNTTSVIPRSWTIVLCLVLTALMVVIISLTLKEFLWGYRLDIHHTQFEHTSNRYIHKLEMRCQFNEKKTVFLQGTIPQDVVLLDVQIWDRFGNLVYIYKKEEIVGDSKILDICIGPEKKCEHWLDSKMKGRGWIIVRLFGTNTLDSNLFKIEYQ